MFHNMFSRNLKALHYPWEKSWHTRQFIGPLSEHGLLGYLFPAFRYSYYSTPDGKDVHLKALWWVKYGGLAGFSWALFHGTGNISAHSETSLQKTLRYVKCTGTPIVAGVTYASLSAFFTNFRGKDDPLNNGFAGAAAGGIVGACIRNPTWGSAWALIFGLTGALVKYLQQHQENHVLPNKFMPRDTRMIWGFENKTFDPWFRQEVENRPSTVGQKFN